MANYTVQIKPNKTAVTSVQIAKTPSIYLSQIADVDAGDTLSKLYRSLEEGHSNGTR